MENFILILHVLIALAIIGLILLQQGKGAEVGASFGAGASQTIFGSAGSWNFFSKFTAILATLFFITSFGLAIIAKNNAEAGGEALPELEVVPEVPIETDVPTVDESDTTNSDDVPTVDSAESDEVSDVPEKGQSDE